jgi:sterol desaturase/sphingolipid hydroxylase (fatty acid hydroxylase superfamily)
MTALLIKIVAAIGLTRFLIAIAVFVPLERLAPYRGRQGLFRDGWSTDVTNFAVNGMLWIGIIHYWRKLAVTFSWLQPLKFNLHGQPAIVHILATIGIGSFVFYWSHRTLHRVPFLWRFHSIHHSVQSLDWLAVYRGHVLETGYYTILTTIPFALLDVSTPAILSYSVYRFLEAHIEHSNVQLPLGPFKWIFPSPRFHQWHHALDADAQNKNFSSYPIWDLVFGTAFMPADRLPEGFGVDAPVPQQYSGQLVYPFGLAPRLDRVRRWFIGLLRPATGKAAPEY